MCRELGQSSALFVWPGVVELCVLAPLKMVTLVWLFLVLAGIGGTDRRAWLVSVHFSLRAGPYGDRRMVLTIGWVRPANLQRGESRGMARGLGIGEWM